MNRTKYFNAYNKIALFLKNKPAVFWKHKFAANKKNHNLAKMAKLWFKSHLISSPQNEHLKDENPAMSLCLEIINFFGVTILLCLN
ncbi:hypothetical protein [Bacillus thuringiensis]|uniref:hypothetical protein n=1 Tax=Bacillus thuringiensis TaxID=1428 RepID=UPI003B985ABB